MYVPFTSCVQGVNTTSVNSYMQNILTCVSIYWKKRHCTKIEIFHYGFFSQCDQVRRSLRIWLHLLNKYLMENFIFCSVGFHMISSFQFVNEESGS